MEKIKAYEKLIGDIQQDLQQLQIEIDTIPDINPLNIFFNFFQHNFFNSTQIKELYSRLDKLRAKAQNGLDYYEIAAIKPSVQVQTDQHQEIDNNQKMSANQDISINLEISTIQENGANQEVCTNQKTSPNQESTAIEDSYFSQLIDLLADINFLEKRLCKKDTQRFPFL